MQTGASTRPLKGRACRGLVRVLCGALLCASSMAAAGDIVVGLGRDNIGSGDIAEATALHVEYHTGPLVSFGWGGVAAMGVVETDDQGDRYAGIGLAGRWDATERWFVEASFAAGHYDRGSEGLDLGGSLEFRTLLGVGYRLSERTRLSLAIDHLSNAGLDEVNPGRDAVFLRLARTF